MNLCLLLLSVTEIKDSEIKMGRENRKEIQSRDLCWEQKSYLDESGRIPVVSYVQAVNLVTVNMFQFLMKSDTEQ